MDKTQTLIEALAPHGEVRLSRHSGAWWASSGDEEVAGDSLADALMRLLGYLRRRDADPHAARADRQYDEAKCD
jgi:hypothetical protein